MKKGIISVIILIALIAGSTFLYIRSNPPLAVSGFVDQEKREVMVVDVGNKYPIGSIEITEVLVNNRKQPSQAKVQISDHSEGFVLSDRFTSEEAGDYQFDSLENVKLKPNTDTQSQLEKLNEGTISDDRVIYGVTLGHEESINKVIIKYRYFGLPYEEVVTTD